MREKNKNTLENIKNLKWLVPGWVFYEFYKSNKAKGNTKSKSFVQGAQAEVVRIVTFASLPLPGTYELTTVGLALLKKKVDSGEIKDIKLKAFKDFIPITKIKSLSNNKGRPYVRIYFKNKKMHFDVFYKK